MKQEKLGGKRTEKNRKEQERTEEKTSKRREKKKEEKLNKRGWESERVRETERAKRKESAFIILETQGDSRRCISCRQLRRYRLSLFAEMIMIHGESETTKTAYRYDVLKFWCPRCEQKEFSGNAPWTKESWMKDPNQNNRSLLLIRVLFVFYSLSSHDLESKSCWEKRSGYLQSAE